MGVVEVLCMNGGTGETSYAANSTAQNKIIREVGPLIEKSIRDVCSTIKPECLTVADLGCSLGPNALAVLQRIIQVVVSSGDDQIPELKLFMNDLPQNDFNTIFKSLPRFYEEIKKEIRGDGIQCCVSGTPGSFYGRLFPTDFLHFIHSSYSLHWLSQVPKGLVKEDKKEALNKGCIYARKASPPMVLQAYREQFTKDFTTFLRCRSKEVIHGGRMLLTFVGTHDDEDSFGMKPINEALNKLALEGIINKEKLDEFNLPLYCPTIQQVRELIEEEKSFAIDSLDTFTLPQAVAPCEDKDEEKTDVERNNAKYMATNMRAVVESVIAAEFGEVVLTHEFMRTLEESCANHLSNTKRVGELNLVVSLVKK